jgi:hypothetical protein
MDISKERADKIRLAILAMSDEDLSIYAHAVFAETFETVPERIERVAAEFTKTLPF